MMGDKGGYVWLKKSLGGGKEEKEGDEMEQGKGWKGEGTMVRPGKVGEETLVNAK